MGMIRVDTPATIIPEPQPSKSTVENMTCLTIRTGNMDCVAQFYPSLYQLVLIKNGAEEKIDLGFSGSRLLERLARTPGDVIDRDELISYAWSGRVVGQGSLNQQIYTLRQIFSDESERKIIQTLPRRGYFLNPSYVDISVEINPVSEPATTEPIAADVVEPVLKPVLAPSAGNQHQYKWRTPALTGLAATVLLGSGILYNYAVSTTPATNAKLLTITYAPHHQDELMSLLPHGKNIEHHLSAKVTAPLQVVVGLHDNQLDLVCLRADGSARTLHIAESQLDQLTDSDLESCLP